MKRRSKIIVGGAVLLLAAAGVVASVSWKTWIEAQMKARLAAAGFPGVQFTIASAGLHSMTFENIAMAEHSPYRLQAMTVDYSPLELWHGTISRLHASDARIKQDGIEIRIGDAQLDTEPQKDGGLKGRWHIGAIAVSGAPLDLPVLAGEGTWTWNADAAALEGAFSDAGRSYRASFAFSLPAHDEKGALLTVRSAALPWNGGTLSVKDVSVPLAGTQPVNLTLQVSKVDLQLLLQEALSTRVTASGTVSGAVPVTVRRDGSFTLHNGTLKASQAGTIMLSPDAIPGDNAQVALVREVLRNFHYTDLSMTLGSDPHDKLSILLSLAGNNPDAYNGREVKLNVHLTGDILDLLQQSVMTLNEPGRFLKEGSHEKK